MIYKPVILHEPNQLIKPKTNAILKDFVYNKMSFQIQNIEDDKPT